MKKPNYFYAELNSREVTIYLYGTIERWSENSAKSYSMIIQELGNKYDVVHLRVHSGGGDVFEGIAIFNLIRQCTAKFIGYVDGIAASMASIIILACDKIKMAKNTFLMIHLPSVEVYGNAIELQRVIDLLEKIRDSLYQHYKDKNPEAAEKFNAWQDGQDHWLTAQEALECGLIDSIIEEESTVEDMTSLAGIDDVKARMNKFTFSIPNVDNHNSDHKPEEEMKFHASTLQAINAFGFAYNENSDPNAVVTAMAAKITSLQAKVKAAEDEVYKTFKNRVKATLDNAVSSKRITNKQREHFEKLSETKEGFEVVEAMIGDMPVREPLHSMVDKTDQKGAGRDNWDWDKYQEEDPEALEAMPINNKEQYITLFKGKYGTEPSLD